MDMVDNPWISFRSNPFMVCWFCWFVRLVGVVGFVGLVGFVSFIRFAVLMVLLESDFLFLLGLSLNSLNFIGFP